MKRLLTVFLAMLAVCSVIFVSACGSNTNGTSTSTYKDVFADHVIKERYENGNAKRVVYYRPDGSVNFEYEYNEYGRKTKETFYDADGVMKEYSVYEYSKKGFLLKASSYDKNGALSGVAEYAGRKSGESPKKFTAYSANGNIAKVFEYNEAGHIISETLYDSDGKKARYRAYLGTGVEDDSTLTEEIRYDALNGEETYHHKYEYNENGKLLKDIAIPGASMTYEYDENGGVIRRSTILSDGSLKDYYTIEYTSDGRRERRISHSGATLGIIEYSGEKIKSSVSYGYIGTNINSYTVSVYNSNGRKTKETNYDRRGAEVSSSEYEYNENGFRTIMRHYKAGALDYVLEYPGKDYGESYIRKTEYNPDGSVRIVVYPRP